jgi:hypothetical protein
MMDSLVLEDKPQPPKDTSPYTLHHINKQSNLERTEAKD